MDTGVPSGLRSLVMSAAIVFALWNCDCVDWVDVVCSFQGVGERRGPGGSNAQCVAKSSLLGQQVNGGRGRRQWRTRSEEIIPVCDDKISSQNLCSIFYITVNSASEHNGVLLTQSIGQKYLRSTRPGKLLSNHFNDECVLNGMGNLIALMVKGLMELRDIVHFTQLFCLSTFKAFMTFKVFQIRCDASAGFC